MRIARSIYRDKVAQRGAVTFGRDIIFHRDYERLLMENGRLVTPQLSPAL